jgi:hypothetical protein
VGAETPSWNRWQIGMQVHRRLGDVDLVDLPGRQMMRTGRVQRRPERGEHLVRTCRVRRRRDAVGRRCVSLLTSHNSLLSQTIPAAPSTDRGACESGRVATAPEQPGGKVRAGCSPPPPTDHGPPAPGSSSTPRTSYRKAQAEGHTLSMARYGYARVSTRSQTEDSQLDALHAAGYQRIWTDTASGRLTRRP